MSESAIGAHGGREYLQKEYNKAKAEGRTVAMAKLLAHVFGSANEVEMMTSITNKINSGYLANVYEEKEVNRVIRKYKHKLFNKGFIAFIKRVFSI